MYPTMTGRVAVEIFAPTPEMPLTTVSGRQNNGGDGAYLPYFDEEITSIRLSCPSGAIELFFTANMTGCKFYVDSIQGSNDLIVYHANTHLHSAGHGYADFQQVNANTVLDGMHTAAQQDYLPLVLHEEASCNMPTYFASGGQEERRKEMQGRKTTSINGLHPEFMGLCSVFGFPRGLGWQFWFQTCGDVEYKRPFGKTRAFFTGHWEMLGKLKTEGRSHKASYKTFRVFDHERIYP
jgi:hypothetical protein